MARARSFQINRYPNGYKERVLYFYVRIMDNADEQAVRQLGLGRRVEFDKGRRVIMCNSREEAVSLCVKINDLANSFRLPKGTDPLTFMRRR